MIYLDHNSTTPIHTEVADLANQCLQKIWGNPSSSYSLGVKARQVIERSRIQVAQLCGASPEQVFFTSGATESNNTILQSSILNKNSSRKILTSKVEHSSILNSCHHLEKHLDTTVNYLGVGSEGQIPIDELKVLLQDPVSLVSMMWVNNETGAIAPISEISSICKNVGVPFHTDAVQAAGKIPIDFESSAIDFLSLSGHKIGAPKGIGAMIIRDPKKFFPLIHGGQQEGKLRAGTENVAYIAALGKAAEIESLNLKAKEETLSILKDQFEKKLKVHIPSAVINGEETPRVSNTSNFHIPDVDGNTVVTYLNTKDIFVSSGSACLEQTITPSHVIYEMYGSYERASESVRVSFGVSNTIEDVNHLVEALANFASIYSS